MESIKHDDQNPIFSPVARGFNLTVIGGCVLGNGKYYAHLIAEKIAQVIHLRNLRQWQAAAASELMHTRYRKKARRDVRNSLK